MNSKPSPATLKFMETYKVDSDEVWEVRAGTWAIKHAALERIAAEQKISFQRPDFIEARAADKIVAMVVSGRMGEREEWSVGEAAPANNKNSYCYAMAEKRAKDRVILKLLNAHGVLYSDAEAEDFANGKPTLAKKDAREIYNKMGREIKECLSRDQLHLWMDANKERIAILPDDWQDTLRLQCQELLLDLKQRESQ